ncbi:MAG: magnesium chelatase subunit H [Betaproteobacteria bacterium]|nr:magnesium chelatase subunit H [Betaproteobacteria bacterium]
MKTQPSPEAIRICVITLDAHLASAMDEARRQLIQELSGLRLTLHAAAEFAADAGKLKQCLDDIAQADIIVANMLFLEEHIRLVQPALQARRPHCDAMLVCLSASEVTKLTRVGRFDMQKPGSAAMNFLKKLRGSARATEQPSEDSLECATQQTGFMRRSTQSAAPVSSGEKQMAMLRRLPKILRFIPGTAQDVRVYFLCMQYWLAGSQGNLGNMLRLLIDRYASGPRAALRGRLKIQDPIEYPEVGLYHPALAQAVTTELADLPCAPLGPDAPRVGVLVLRSYLLANNTAHYDAVIRALEARGMQVITAFASGLDARSAIERYFFDEDGKPGIDLLLSLTGFSLVGGPAYNDSNAAQAILRRLDVPYLAAQAVEFQLLDQWEQSERGLMPVESTMMVAIPELDGATGSMVFGGRAPSQRNMSAHPERVQRLAARVQKLVGLRRQAQASRKLAIVIFGFPPNAGNLGTAAHLDVFASLWHLLCRLSAEGYQVDVPASVDDLRERLLKGNAMRYGSPANVAAQVPLDDYIERETWVDAIAAQWGPAPGRLQTDGQSIFVYGLDLGHVFIGVQPALGYEGDPMRMLFEKSFTPTHAFAAFYRYLRERFQADAILHFGTHGALEFMPGKQCGMSEACWPDRLIGDTPHFYFYAANNPSEGTIAKRRAAATLVSYRTPPLAQAGLYAGLHELKTLIERWRALAPELHEERQSLQELIVEQACELELLDAKEKGDRLTIAAVQNRMLEIEQCLIPEGMHQLGSLASGKTLLAWSQSMLQAACGKPVTEGLAQALVDASLRLARLEPVPRAQAVKALSPMASAAGVGADCLEPVLVALAQLQEDHETEGLLRALRGRFIEASAGGDILRNPEVLPAGRNIHGFDPFRIPSRFAMADGRGQAERLIARHQADGHGFPESIALVLWGSDNLKSEGAALAQALALMGAGPRFDSYGRLAGAQLIPLEVLKRPRIDVTMSLSGIFRDLLPLQTRMLAEAAYLAASADEPLSMNLIRRNTLAHQQAQGCDFETACLRVFSNADGAYGANINHLIESSQWEEEDELAGLFSRRKSFAYNRRGEASQQAEMLSRNLSQVSLAYQNLDAAETGVTSLDQYFDSLGGISRAVAAAQGRAIPVYISDQTQGSAKVRSLQEQVDLEARTRMLNPKWYEAMLKHGYEGVRQIESHLTNTMGWSATTGKVPEWVYQQVTETFIKDREMRDRLANLNPDASAKLVQRLLEAHERRYWQPDPQTLQSLREASDDIEDRIEGVYEDLSA